MSYTQRDALSRIKHYWNGRSGLAKVALLILSVRLLGAILQALAPITMPHTWRQVDTMGVALRYALRWTVESTSEAIPWWVPAVLNSGDTAGATVMEFPLLNMLGAVGFILGGSDVDLGRSLAMSLCLVLVFVLIAICILAWSKLSGAPKQIHRGALLLACVASFSTPYTAKFMPDLTAMLLSLIGVAGIWNVHLWGVIFLALGLLVKPTSCVVVALFLLHPAVFRPQFFRKRLAMVCAALVLPALWYLKVVPHIKTLQQQSALFEMHDHFAPFTKLIDFWTSAGIWDVLSFHSLFPFGWVLVVWGALWLTRQASKKNSVAFLTKLFLIALLQASVIGALSADHARLHAYYLIGLSPVMILMVWTLWDDLPKTRLWMFWRSLLVIGLFVRCGEAFVADANGHWDERQGRAWFDECRELRALVPEAPWRKNEVWRTPVEEYPFIELCLGERGRGAKSPWGVFRKDSQSHAVLLPEELRQTHSAGCIVRAETARLALVYCDVTLSAIP